MNNDNLTLEYKRNFIQERKLEVLRKYHENVGRLKAAAFEFSEESDVKKKEKIFKEIELLKKVIRKQLMDVDKYNEFLAHGHVKPKETKGLVVDVKI